MLATRQSLRFVRLQPRRQIIPIPRPQFRPIHAQRTFATTPRRLQKPDTENDEAIREEYVRGVREQWGHNLPENLLTPKEFAMYERHYGKPVRMLKEGENPFEGLEEEGIEGEGKLEIGTVTLQDKDGENVEIFEEEVVVEEEVEVELGSVAVDIQNPADAKAYEQLQKDMDRAFRKKEDEEFYLEEEEGEGDEEGYAGFRDDGSHTVRTHPLTSIGRFATFPSTVRIPPSVQQPTMESLSDVSNKHLDDAAVRVFGSRSLPDSPIFTNRGGKGLKSVLLDVEDSKMSNIESELWLASVLPGYYSQSVSALTELRRRLGGDWVLGNGGEGGVKNVLDVGSGGAGVLAWKSIVEAEQTRRRDEERERSGAEEPAESEPEPETSNLKATVVTGPEPLRYRMSKLLENTTFLPRIPDRNPENVYNSPSQPPVNFEPNQKQTRKVYDLIIATNNMLPLKENHQKRDRLKKLWSHLNPKGGILLLIEKGTPLGFEAIAGARSTLLRNHISSEGSEFRPIGGNTGLDIDDEPIEKEVGAIIAPCTNHKECPMFPKGYTNGVGRRDWCHFVQRYERPVYLQRIMGEGVRNHDDLLYSYVAVRRGVDYRREKEVIKPEVDEFKHAQGWGMPTHSPYSMEELRRYAFTLPRTLFPPIKRHGHVILDMCTPEGQIERWTVPKSYSKVAYRDARKSKWGDLWALGGKSKTPRNIKTGGGAQLPRKNVLRIFDEEGNVEEKVTYPKNSKNKDAHWFRGKEKFGDKQRKLRDERREVRWATRKSEMDVDKGDTY